MCSLRDAATDFAAHGITVYGISTDDVRSQARFHEEQKLNFKLLSDPDGSTASKFGVLRKDRPFARRVTFVIDDQGVLRHIAPKVDVRAHGQQVLDIVAKLRK